MCLLYVSYTPRRFCFSAVWLKICNTVAQRIVYFSQQTGESFSIKVTSFFFFFFISFSYTRRTHRGRSRRSFSLLRILLSFPLNERKHILSLAHTRTPTAVVTPFAWKWQRCCEMVRRACETTTFLIRTVFYGRTTLKLEQTKSLQRAVPPGNTTHHPLPAPPETFRRQPPPRRDENPWPSARTSFN